MPDLNKLSPTALRAAMRTGTEGWGRHGSALAHAMYVEPVDKRVRRRRRMCRCGCRKMATHRAMANGVCMSSGCELAMRRFAKRYS